MSKKFKKVFAALVAFVLIAAIVYFANGTVGNPVSKFAAEKASQKYILSTYPELNLSVSDAQYDFKMLCYIVDVSSPDSADTYFSLYYGFFGNLTTDTYSFRVLEGANTFSRVNDEYSSLIKNVFNTDSRYSDSFGELENTDGAISLELDKKYELNPLGKKYGHLYVDIYTDDISEENICAQLIDLKKLFDSKNVSFAFADLSLRSNKADSFDSLSVNNFRYSDITEKGIKMSVANNISLNGGLDKKQQEVLTATTRPD